jgi:hypothetical protein
VLSEYSCPWLQVFDVVVVAPLKKAFTFELDQRISWFTDANPGERDKTQIIHWILIKSCINAWHRSATSANIISRLRATGIISINSEILLESQFASDPPSDTIRHTGAEINEMSLMFSSGLDLLCRHELMKPMKDANHNLNDRQIWEDRKSNSVTEGRQFWNPPLMFRRSDASTIRHVNIHNLNV